jgi:hypothetical protein
MSWSSREGSWSASATPKRSERGANPASDHLPRSAVTAADDKRSDQHFIARILAALGETMREVHAAIRENAARTRSARFPHLGFAPSLQNRETRKAANDIICSLASAGSKACDVGFRGKMAEWQRLLGAAPRRQASLRGTLPRPRMRWRRNSLGRAASGSPGVILRRFVPHSQPGCNFHTALLERSGSSEIIWRRISAHVPDVPLFRFL